VHGTAAANANGTIAYTPTPGYVGTDAFTYQASDGTALSAPATVTLEVRPLNQAPTTTGLPSLVLNEDERDPADTTGTVWRRVDLLSAFEDKEDADSALRFAVTTNSMPALFSAVRVETGTLLLVFPPDANGTAVLMVRATDTGGASVETPLTVTVKPVNDPPLAADDTTTFDWPSTTAVTIAVLANDVDPDGNDAPKPSTVAIVRQALAGQAKANADGTVLYTADAGFPGVDTFSYTVSDAAGATSATATVTVGAAAGWEFGLSLAGTALAIGMHKDASDGLDPFLDLPANLPPQGGNTAVRASLLPDAAGTELARDYRGLAAAATWLLEVVNPSQDTTAALTWNQGAPQAKQLYLIQVGADGVSVPNGVSVAMHEIGSATVPANGTCYFTISFGVATFEMRLQTGWNLVSVPVQPLDASTAAVFAGATVGQPWRWSGSEYRVADRIQPLVGYWVVHQGEPVTVVIRGTPVFGTAATVNQGWNLVGPLADIDIPASNAAKVDSIYWYADGSYRLAKPYEAGKTPAQNAADRNGLVRGFGYWLYGLQPTSLRLE
jgi:hypothetical protein